MTVQTPQNSMETFNAKHYQDLVRSVEDASLRTRFQLLLFIVYTLTFSNCIEVGEIFRVFDIFKKFIHTFSVVELRTLEIQSDIAKYLNSEYRVVCEIKRICIGEMQDEDVYLEYKRWEHPERSPVLEPLMQPTSFAARLGRRLSALRLRTPTQKDTNAIGSPMVFDEGCNAASTRHSVLMKEMEKLHQRANISQEATALLLEETNRLERHLQKEGVLDRADPEIIHCHIVYLIFGYLLSEKLNLSGDAVNYISSAIECYQSSFAYFSRGRIIETAKLKVEDYRKSIELDPRSMAYNNLALQIENNYRDYERALECYNSALYHHPYDYVCYNNRGLLYENRLGNRAMALHDYSKAIELNPNYSIAWNNRGVCYKRLHRYDLALYDYNMAIEVDPTYQNAINNRDFLHAIIKEFSSIGNI